MTFTLRKGILFAVLAIVLVLLVHAAYASQLLVFVQGNFSETSDKSSILAGIAAAFFKKGDIDTAEQIYEKSLELNQEDSQAHYNHGVSLYYTNDIDGAEEEFRKSIELNSGYGLAHYSYGLLLYHEKRLDEAVNELGIAYSLDPENPQIAYDLAISLSDDFRYDHGEISNLESAQSFFEEAAIRDYPHARDNAETIKRIIAEYYDYISQHS